MRNLRLLPASLLIVAAITSANRVRAQGAFALLHSLFDPSTNAQWAVRQGYSTAASGNIAVVGVPYADIGALDAGVVKVYDAGTGVLLHTLLNPDPDGQEYFGRAVAISGTLVVIGSGQGDGGTNRAGSVFVYDLANSTPAVPMMRLNNPTTNVFAEDHFGTAVGMSGTRIVVGADRKLVRIRGRHLGHPRDGRKRRRDCVRL